MTSAMFGKPIVIFGTGDFARIARLYFVHDGTRQVVAFCVDDPAGETSFEGLPLIPFEVLDAQYPAQDVEVFVAIGYSKVNKTRADVFERVQAAGYRFARFVHSSVKIWPGTSIGDNTFIFENNVVQPGVNLGEDVIIWSRNHIGHDVRIGDHCFICSDVVIAGHAQIGARCFLGINASVRDGVTVGDGCVIGAGALVLNDCDADGVYVAEGTQRARIPASRLRSL